jgi:hypothetical protein
VRFAPWEAQGANSFKQVVDLPLICNVHAHEEVFWVGEVFVYEFVYIKDRLDQSPNDLNWHPRCRLSPRLRFADSIVTRLPRLQHPPTRGIGSST